MVPRIFVWLVFAVGSLGAACSLMSPHFERPNLSVANVQLVSGNLLQQNFLVTFDVQNPNPRPLPVTSLHAELTVLGEQVASGLSNRAFVVPPNGETQFDMTFKANLGLALMKLGRRTGADADSVDYRLTGAANVDLPLLHDVPFDQKGSLSLGSLLSGSRR